MAPEDPKTAKSTMTGGRGLWSLPLLLARGLLAAPPAPLGAQVVGDLELHPLTSEIFGNTRSLRVWLPPGICSLC